MLLEVILMFCFEILRIFEEKSQKMSKLETWAQWTPTPQRREPTPWRRPMPQRGMPRRSEAEVPKWHPSNTPQRSYCS